MKLNVLNNNNDFFYIICPYGIGDFIFSLSIATKFFNNKNLCFIVKDYLKDIKLNVTHKYNILSISREEMEALIKIIIDSGNYIGENYFYSHYKKKDHCYLDTKTKYFNTRYLLDIYNLPENYIYDLPTIDSISNAEKIELDRYMNKINNPAIVLIPHSKTVNMIPNAIWEIFVDYLKSKNYTVFTNISKDEKAIVNTIPLSLTLPQLNYISDKITAFIGIRTGLMDYLALGKAKIIAVSYIHYWSFELEHIFPKANTDTVYLCNKNNTEYLEQYSNYVESEKISFSYIELLNKIIKLINN